MANKFIATKNFYGSSGMTYKGQEVEANDKLLKKGLIVPKETPTDKPKETPTDKPKEQKRTRRRS